ncbi:autoinducer 2 ABC transporter substrate-binding protein [Cohnella boryungensis]|uniref:Autoinducer 2 ABC transporter substrate-binding protein n=1 Tax=Cohnella boryungensis TaxID=768479 RepID=A0ABV8SA51_9BACL
MYRALSIFLALSLLLLGCRSGAAEGYELIYSMEPGTSPAAPAATDSSTGTDGAAPRYRIALVPKGVGIDYFEYAAEGAREAAADLGIELIYQGPASADADLQMNTVKQLIDLKVDLIAISANDPVKLVPVLRKAMEQGIKVITWDADTQEEGRQFFVNMVEPEMLGRHLLDTLALTMGEKGKFAIMTSSFAAANNNEWLAWIKVQQRDYYPDLELVQTVTTGDDLNRAYEAAARLLADYPDLNGIIGNSSVGPPSAAKAVKEAGKAGRVKVVGLSGPNQMRPHLLDGSAQMSTLWSPKKLGYLTVMLANDLLNGKLPKDGEAVSGVGNIRVNGDMVIMGEPLDFTAENVGQYDF